MDLLTTALDLAFFALLVRTFIAHLRERTRVTRDTVLVFATVAFALAVPLLTGAASHVPALVEVGAQLPPATAMLPAIVLLAQPFLTMRLIEGFRPRMRPVVIASGLVFLASAAAILVIPAQQLGTAPTPARVAVLIGVVAGFVVMEVLAAVLLFGEARERAGAGRIRLVLAAVGTLLFGAAVLVAGIGSASARTDVTRPVSNAIALVAGLAYLAAFVPPMWLRRIWQRSLAYDFLRDLARLPDETPDERIWAGLVSAARRVSGARAAAVVVRGEAGHRVVAPDGVPPDVAQDAEWAEDDLAGRPLLGGSARELDPTRPIISRFRDATGVERLLAVPTSADGTEALLVLGTFRGILFVEDDLEALRVLAEHAALSVERHHAMAERSKLVEQLRNINAELSHASSAKSEFLAGMSHELRTPLHAVIGFSELLMSPDGSGAAPDPTVAEYAAHIHGAGLHLLDLINDVLDLSKIEAGRLDLQYQEFDLAGLVHRTGRTMRPLATRKGVELSFPEPSDVRIDADAARVRQVLFNLLSNAIKFTPIGGHVDIRLDADERDARLTVIDDGPGIPSDDLRRIFEPFEQSAAGRGTNVEGTGLGLAVSRQLAERHGGRIEVESAPGRGSRFTLVLPRRRGGASAEPVRALPAPAEPSERLVLVAEDDPRAAELLAIHLRAAGYEVAFARDGVSALAEAERLHPIAVILDVMLPVMDGWEVLRQLKEDPATVDIPVLIVSVLEESEVGFALGAVDYLVKPVRRDVLAAAVERVTGTADGGGRPLVLAIDDDAEALRLYGAELGRAGYDVRTASSGEEGLRLARTIGPGAILLDLLMPGMDGWEVASRLHADPATSGVPIIVMTSHDLTPADKERLQGKVHQVLEKGPTAPQALLAWLVRVTRAAPDRLAERVGALQR